MVLRKLLCFTILAFSFGCLAAAEHRSPSPTVASVGFANLVDGNIVPPVMSEVITITVAVDAPPQSDF